MSNEKISSVKIDSMAAELTSLAQDIWEHPEVGYHEYHASKATADFLESGVLMLNLAHTICLRQSVPFGAKATR